MIKLPFITCQSDLSKPWAKDLTKQAIYELNNQLTIPMKILKVEYIEETGKDKGWTSINVEVDDCADIKEWDDAVVVFLIGVEYRRKMFKGARANL